jgi:anti-sigma-K factor RskA
VEREEIHDLTAAYALHALAPEDEQAFEEHLRHCARCRDEVAAMLETAADLAHAAPAAAPPPALRAKVLDQARAERGNVTPLRPRWAFPVAAAAAVAACAAVVLGVWAASLHGRLDDRTSALRQRDRVLAVLQAPGARRVALGGGKGSLYVAGAGKAALVLAGLPAAPAGKRYEAWVIAGKAATPAGLFAGGASSALALGPAVVPGSRVGVTLEPAGGSPRPTGRILALSAPV